MQGCLPPDRSAQRLENIARQGLPWETALDEATRSEQSVRGVLLDRAGNTEAVRCLIDATPANAGVRPQGLASLLQAANNSSGGSANGS